MMIVGDTPSGALFSDSAKKYRYALWRIWDEGFGALMFVGLNPSTANETKDDPTIRKLVLLAKDLGYGGLYAGNLFSLVTPHPKELFLKACTDLPGGPNDVALKEMQQKSDMVLAAWGNMGHWAGKRPEAVLSLLGDRVYCLGKNKNGEPRHPLYMPKSTPLIPYHRKEGAQIG